MKNEHAKLVLINGSSLDEWLGIDFAAYSDISSICWMLKNC